MGLDNPLHIAFVLILVLLVFGAKRLPEMGRSLGTGMRGFKETLSGQAPPASLTAEQPSPLAAAESTPAVAVPQMPAAVAAIHERDSPAG